MTGSDVVNKLLEYSMMNPKKFSEKIGLLRPQAIYDIQNGKTKNISPSMADKIISVFPEIDRGWLLTGDGEMLRESHSTSPVGNAAISADKSEMQQTQGSPAPTTENITNLIAITREAMAVIREQSAQMNRLITQVELSNARYDRLFASISGVSTGFPATPTDLGVKNPPPIKSELK